MRYFLTSILIVTIVLLILPIKFKIKYKYKNGDSRLNITTSYIFGLLKPEIYPFDKERRSRKYQTEGKDRIKSIYKDSGYKKFIQIIWEKLILEQILWETKIGFEEAFLVGIISGSLWYFKSIIISLLLAKKDVKKLSYNVKPIFNQNQLDIQFNCIIKIRMVYIITVWIWIIRLNKGGEKFGRTSNRRSNENYYE